MHEEFLAEVQQDTSLPVINLNTLNPDGVTAIINGEKTEKVATNSVEIASRIISLIKDGYVDPLQFAVKRKMIVDAMDIAMKDAEVKKIMIEQVEKYGKEGVSSLGAKLSISSRSTFQYENDPRWKAIKDELKPLEEKLKAQEEKIKIACKTNASLVDENGEVIASVVPNPKTESIAVSFAKK